MVRSVWGAMPGSVREVRMLPWICLCAALTARLAIASDPSPVMQVEEDWELVLGEPDPDSTAPQITTAISPRQTLNNLHAVLEFNHKTVPEFVSGGVHLQMWTGQHNLSKKSIADTDTLSTANETITWTVRMKLDGNAVRFSLPAGSSTTWGSFGGTSLDSWYGTSLANLNLYTPEFTVANSGIGYGANRVQSLVLKRVRYYRADGSTSEDANERVVHALAKDD